MPSYILEINRTDEDPRMVYIFSDERVRESFKDSWENEFVDEYTYIDYGRYSLEDLQKVLDVPPSVAHFLSNYTIYKIDITFADYEAKYKSIRLTDPEMDYDEPGSAEARDRAEYGEESYDRLIRIAYLEKIAVQTDSVV